MTISITYTDESSWLSGFPHDECLNWTQLNLNRQAKQGLPSMSKGFNIPEKHDPIGFRWKSGDGATMKWYPQGITGTANAANPRGSRFLVSSWYGKSEANYKQKGVRLSFVNYDSSSNDFCRYRHVLLVQNVQNINVQNPGLFCLDQTERNLYCQLNLYAPVPIHAGGIAWYKKYLYVVDTRVGIRVFDTTRMYPALADLPNKSKCGVDFNGDYYAFDYRYTLPQIGYYQTEGTEPNSFVSVGDNGRNPCLWVGQYITKGNTKLFGFVLNQDGTIDTSATVEEFTPADENGPAYNMQGVYRSNGNTWMSVTGKSNYKNSTARLITQAAGANKGNRWRWPYGAEDLYLENDKGILWCQTEFPPNSRRLGSDRAVFGVNFASYAPAKYITKQTGAAD